MDLAKLVKEKQMLKVMADINNMVFKQLRLWYPETKDVKSFAGGTVLFTQLLLQDSITKIGSTDAEIDRTLEGDALTLLAKLSLSAVQDAGGLSLTRLQARSKQLKGVINIGNLELWDIPYWLSLTTLQPETECKKMLQTVADWLFIAAKETLEYIIDAHPLSLESGNSLEFDFDVPKPDAPNDSDEKPRKKKKNKDDTDPSIATFA